MWVNTKERQVFNIGRGIAYITIEDWLNCGFDGKKFLNYLDEEPDEASIRSILSNYHDNVEDWLISVIQFNLQRACFEVLAYCNDFQKTKPGWEARAIPRDFVLPEETKRCFVEEFKKHFDGESETPPCSDCGKVVSE